LLSARIFVNLFSSGFSKFWKRHHKLIGAGLNTADKAKKSNKCRIDKRSRVFSCWEGFVAYDGFQFLFRWRHREA